MQILKVGDSLPGPVPTAEGAHLELTSSGLIMLAQCPSLTSAEQGVRTRRAPGLCSCCWHCRSAGLRRDCGLAPSPGANGYEFRRSARADRYFGLLAGHR